MPDEIKPVAQEAEDPRVAIATKMLNDLVDANYRAIAEGGDINSPEVQKRLGDEKRGIIRNFIGEMIQASFKETAGGSVIPSAADELFKGVLEQVSKNPDAIRELVQEVMVQLKAIHEAANVEYNEMATKLGGSQNEE